MRKKIVIIYISLLILIAVMVSITYFSYAFLISEKEFHGKINMVTGTLDYKIESNDLTDNSITLEPSDAKEIELTITSLNPIETKYSLYTNNVSDVDIRYTDELDASTGTISANGEKTVKVALENNVNENKTVVFGVKGGYTNDDIVLENSEIAVVLGEPICPVGTTYEFDYTGDVQEFTAKCSGTYKVELWGAQGGTGYVDSTVGGLGGYTSGTIFLTKQNLYVYVGQNDTTGTLNNKAFNAGTPNNGGWNGGGATDIRLTNGSWDNFDSLKSRIMVAGAGGTTYNNGTAGAGGGLNGYAGGGTNGGTQTTAAAKQGNYNYTLSTFGVANGGCSGGNGYYPSGGAACASGSGGGSSFISGHNGCVAISESSTSDNITPKVSGCTDGTTDINCSIHYSNYAFNNTLMIDGKGCNWSTGSATNCGANQPQPDGTMATGHTGNGYARITYLGKRTVTFNANGGEVSESSRKVNYGYAIGDLPTPTKTGKDFIGWYTDTNYTTRVNSTYVIDDNITLYARYGTEINLNLATRTRGYPSNTATNSNSIARTWDINSYVIGLSSDNWYAPDRIGSYNYNIPTINVAGTTIANCSGYGLAIPTHLEQGNYVFIYDVDTSINTAILYYQSNGTYISATATIPNTTFAVSSSTYYSVILLRTGQNLSVNYSNLHIYKLD